MAYNSNNTNRPLSPGGRRIQNPGRTSDSRVSEASIDQYGSERHNSYASPRSSTSGVIPISSETFVNYPAPQTDRSTRYDSYSGRPKEGSYSNASRSAASSTTQPSSRNPPKVVQSDYARPTSPQKGSQRQDYYVQPATTTATKEPRKEGTTRKVYAVADGTANLVADVSVASGSSERHHKRRESNGGAAPERGGYRGQGPPMESDRGRRGYHLNGPVRTKEKSIDDEDAFSYTTPAGMYRDTEPSWRERDARPVRRSSVDRAGGGGSRERPVSMLDPAFDPRRPNRESGPPPTTRGLDKINDVVSRSASVRERPRDNPQSPPKAPKDAYAAVDSRMPVSPTRGRYAEVGGYGNPRDAYYVPPRMPAMPAMPPMDDRDYPIGGSDYLEARKPRPQERRNSMTRVPDHSVERRGFGIRGDSPPRYARGSEESFARGGENNYRDSGYAVGELQRRETAPELSYYDEQRLEQEKRDRERKRTEEREWQRERDREREARGRDDDQQRRFSRDAEYDLDRQRERDRERMMQPPSDHDHHHHRHSVHRDRDYDRKENGPRDSGDSISQPGLSSAAAVGLGAAAAYGVGSYMNKKDDRSRDRDHERDRVSPRPQELRPPQDVRSTGSHSDDSAHYEKDRDHHRSADTDRGLGFAFENSPEQSKPARDRAESTNTREQQIAEREFERTHDDRPPGDTVQPTTDPDEDYRRRLEQLQRELGRGSDDRTNESDPDRERRRREREQRQRDRELRGGEASVAGTSSTYTDNPASYRIPGSFEDDSVEGSSVTARPGGLRRRRSILDEPMTDEPAQIIDNSLSEKRENRVRIVDPPTEEEEKRPKGILKKPTAKFPEHPDEVREGVAPLKEKDGSSKTGIPPGAKWTKIDRRLVNPEALEEAKERFEERLDVVIVLRVLTKEEIQKLADRTKEIRDERYEDEREERRAARRRDRKNRDEYEDENSEDEFKPRAPKLLEAPSSAGASAADQTDHNHDGKDRRRDDRDSQYMSGGLGRRE